MDSEHRLTAQELLRWREGQGFFTCRLFDLMATADTQNLERIGKGFPVALEVFKDWKSLGVDGLRAKYNVT